MDPVTTGAQDAIYLDQRIRSVEQKLFSIQSSISRLEQQVNLSQHSIPAQVDRSPETELMKNEVEILRARVRELECGLAHLDERTLSAAAKVGRQRAGTHATDPCRLSPETPIQNSRRP
jgi:predicted  nucleic acid-binding Zn-ribbon protein